MPARSKCSTTRAVWPAASHPRSPEFSGIRQNTVYDAKIHTALIWQEVRSEFGRGQLGHNTFTRPAVDLIVRSADGVLRKARNLCVACMIEAVRAANKTIDIDNVNRVLLQPHWRKESDLVDF